ncbi:MAG TPA: hypothetical protein VF209_01895 [Patescibacteria group bacterium]
MSKAEDITYQREYFHRQLDHLLKHSELFVHAASLRLTTFTELISTLFSIQYDAEFGAFKELDRTDDEKLKIKNTLSPFASEKFILALICMSVSPYKKFDTVNELHTYIATLRLQQANDRVRQNRKSSSSSQLQTTVSTNEEPELTIKGGLLRMSVII